MKFNHASVMSVFKQQFRLDKIMLYSISLKRMPREQQRRHRGPRPGRSRGQYSKVTTEMKQRLIEAFEAGDDYHIAARTLGIKLQTARSILLRHREGRPIEDQRGGRREESVRVTSSVVQRLVNMVEQKPDLTLKVMSERLDREAGIKISMSSVARALDGELISMKKLQDCPAKRNSVRAKRLRADYADWYLQQDANKVLVYVDESCFNIFTRRTRGRSAIGQPAFRQLQFERGKNLNLVMAVTDRVGVLYYELHRGTMTKERFQHFLDNLGNVLRATGGAMTDVVVVMDNASVHNGATCDDADIKYLPPYSPFLNPIENCFSTFKLKLREVLREESVTAQIMNVPVGLSAAEHRLQVLQIEAAKILEDMETISGATVSNMCRHLMTYMHRCSIESDIVF